jgi:tetratricopeptide (TPR) repeat protein
MMVRTGMRIFASLIAIIFVAACAGPVKEKPQNDLVSSAQTMERRAAQAYTLGDLDSAAGAYSSAASVYESLALAQPSARARLSAALALAEAGRNDAALGMVNTVLALPFGLDSSTLLMAHGRAAALHLAASAQTGPAAAQSAAVANSHWLQAQALCQQVCSAQAALWVLRARIDVTQGDTAAAVRSAGAALALGEGQISPGERANALRVRAQANAALGQPAQTVRDATEALALDQEAGNARRVQLDLQLLASAYQALGQAEPAARFALLAARAQAASAALRSGAP